MNIVCRPVASQIFGVGRFDEVVDPGTIHPFRKGSKGLGEDWGKGQLVSFLPVKESGEHCKLPQRVLGCRLDCPKVLHYFQHPGWPLVLTL